MLNIQKNIILADYSTFKIGGPTKEFVEVRSEEELVEALDYAKKNDSKFFVFGGGSNVLFDDKGFDGLIIKTGDLRFEIGSQSIKCGAGMKLSELVNLAKENELSGLEWAVGIPGTVGGAIRGNAEAFKKSLADLIEKVKVINVDNLKIMDYGPEDCKFEYRNSIFKQDPKLVIVSAIIKLEKGNRKEIEARMKEFSEKRSEKQPTGWKGSAGSFFMNPVVDNEDLKERFERETGSKCTENRIPAGWIIDEAGFKGKKIGGMMVSEKNANFLINTGEGKSEEAIMLASIIKQKVRNEFGIQLKEEIQYVN